MRSWSCLSRHRHRLCKRSPCIIGSQARSRQAGCSEDHHAVPQDSCRSRGYLAWDDKIAWEARPRLNCQTLRSNNGYGAMTTYFISRHPGARRWIARQPLRIDAMVTHLDVATIRQGDTVIGSLPANLAAAVCQSGARYLHVSLTLPPTARGRELTADEMDGYGAHIEEYRVLRVSL